MRTIGAAVIGAGAFGARHAEKYAASPHATLQAIVDNDPERAAALAKRFGVEPLSSIAELPPDVEAVSIVTPTMTHHSVGMEAIGRGLHLLVEKPIAAAVEDGIALARAAQARGLVLQVGHIERFSAVFEALQAIITRPLFIESHRIAPFSGRGADVNVVLDLMIHDIDLLTALVGSAVESVDAVGAPVLTDQEDIANARVRFANGCVANITASRVSMKSERKLRIFQADSYVVADFAARKVSCLRRERGGEGDWGAIGANEDTFPQTDSLQREIDSFVAAVAGGHAPRVSGTDGVEALRTALTIEASLRAHRAFIDGVMGAPKPGTTPA